MKKSVNIVLILALLLIAAVAISGCAQYGVQQGEQQVPQTGEEAQEAQPAAPAEAAEAQPAQQAQPPAPPAPPQQQAAGASEKTIEITATGFSPNTLTVRSGDTVVFVNKDTAQHWPASAVHPTHAVYPEPGGCFGSKFDACKGLAQGESFTFVFNQKGSWKYHDHLNPSLWGTIVVE